MIFKFFGSSRFRKARLFFKRILQASGIFILIFIVLLVITAVFTPLPPELSGANDFDISTEIRDRHGTVLRELRAGDGTRSRFCRASEAGPLILKALIAAEDRRFQWHPGIDPISITRAAFQWAIHGRVVSGASTITQQLARTLVPRPRSIRSKFLEMALALRIEAALSKNEILEQYINRIAFGPGLKGVEAASRFYFDKPPRDLSLGEAAAIAGMPRGPSIYDPRKGTERLQKRRARVLSRMQDSGYISGTEAEAAELEPIVVAKAGAGLGAPHLVRGLLAGNIDQTLEKAPKGLSSITLTIDRGLQRELELLAQRTMLDLDSRKVSAASLIVLENKTGEILAYVGSPDIENTIALGHNDGVLAKRQPGSTLKPFIYELAMERLEFKPSTRLPDIELHFPSKDGTFQPNNYDGRFHGPVLLREALANSYNVPAVWTAAALGPDRVLKHLQKLGFHSLDKLASVYGAAIALGDGEVRLLELCNAYAALARGGLLLPVRALKSALDEQKNPLPLPQVTPARVMDEAQAYLITHILSDKSARLASFGEANALELPFPAAAKTGTSKGFRDNYTVGYTPEFTVAVWVGNFDGSPMEGVSGITGAGPLFHEAMLATARILPPSPFVPPGDRIVSAEICPLSGERPTPDCPHHRLDLFAAEYAPGPVRDCSIHRRVRIEKKSGLRAGKDCPESDTEERVFEQYGPEFIAWAKSTGRPLAPESYSPRCPEKDSAPDSGASQKSLRIAYPPNDFAFVIDPSAIAPQSVRIRVDAPAEAKGVTLRLNGKPIPLKSAPFFYDFKLVPGQYTARAEAEGIKPSDEVQFSVE